MSFQGSEGSNDSGKSNLNVVDKNSTSNKNDLSSREKFLQLIRAHVDAKLIEEQLEKHNAPLTQTERDDLYKKLLNEIAENEVLQREYLEIEASKNLNQGKSAPESPDAKKIRLESEIKKLTERLNLDAQKNQEGIDLNLHKIQELRDSTGDALKKLSSLLKKTGITIDNFETMIQSEDQPRQKKIEKVNQEIKEVQDKISDIWKTLAKLPVVDLLDQRIDKSAKQKELEEKELKNYEDQLKLKLEALSKETDPIERGMLSENITMLRKRVQSVKDLISSIKENIEKQTKTKQKHSDLALEQSKLESIITGKRKEIETIQKERQPYLILQSNLIDNDEKIKRLEQDNAKLSKNIEQNKDPHARIPRLIASNLKELESLQHENLGHKSKSQFSAEDLDFYHQHASKNGALQSALNNIQYAIRLQRISDDELGVLYEKVPPEVRQKQESSPVEGGSPKAAVKPKKAVISEKPKDFANNLTSSDKELFAAWHKLQIKNNAHHLLKQANGDSITQQIQKTNAKQSQTNAEVQSIVEKEFQIQRIENLIVPHGDIQKMIGTAMDYWSKLEPGVLLHDLEAQRDALIASLKAKKMYSEDEIQDNPEVEALNNRIKKIEFRDKLSNFSPEKIKVVFDKEPHIRQLVLESYRNQALRNAYDQISAAENDAKQKQDYIQAFVNQQPDRSLSIFSQVQDATTSRNLEQQQARFIDDLKKSDEQYAILVRELENGPQTFDNIPIAQQNIEKARQRLSETDRAIATALESSGSLKQSKVSQVAQLETRIAELEKSQALLEQEIGTKNAEFETNKNLRTTARNQLSQVNDALQNKVKQHEEVVRTLTDKEKQKSTTNASAVHVLESKLSDEQQYFTLKSNKLPKLIEKYHQNQKILNTHDDIRKVSELYSLGKKIINPIANQRVNVEDLQEEYFFKLAREFFDGHQYRYKDGNGHQVRYCDGIKDPRYVKILNDLEENSRLYKIGLKIRDNQYVPDADRKYFEKNVKKHVVAKDVFDPKNFKIVLEKLEEFSSGDFQRKMIEEMWTKINNAAYSRLPHQNLNIQDIVTDSERILAKHSKIQNEIIAHEQAIHLLHKQIVKKLPESKELKDAVEQLNLTRIEAAKSVDGISKFDNATREIEARFNADAFSRSQQLSILLDTIIDLSVQIESIQTEPEITADAQLVQKRKSAQDDLDYSIQSLDQIYKKIGTGLTGENLNILHDKINDKIKSGNKSLIPLEEKLRKLISDQKALLLASAGQDIQDQIFELIKNDMIQRAKTSPIPADAANDVTYLLYEELQKAGIPISTTIDNSDPSKPKRTGTIALPPLPEGTEIPSDVRIAIQTLNTALNRISDAHSAKDALNIPTDALIVPIKLDQNGIKGLNDADGSILRHAIVQMQAKLATQQGTNKKPVESYLQEVINTLDAQKLLREKEIKAKMDEIQKAEDKRLADEALQREKERENIERRREQRIIDAEKRLHLLELQNVREVLEIQEKSIVAHTTKLLSATMPGGVPILAKNGSPTVDSVKSMIKPLFDGLVEILDQFTKETTALKSEQIPMFEDERAIKFQKAYLAKIKDTIDSLEHLKQNIILEGHEQDKLPIVTQYIDWLKGDIAKIEFLATSPPDPMPSIEERRDKLIDLTIDILEQRRFKNLQGLTEANSALLKKLLADIRRLDTEDVSIKRQVTDDELQKIIEVTNKDLPEGLQAEMREALTRYQDLITKNLNANASVLALKNLHLKNQKQQIQDLFNKIAKHQGNLLAVPMDDLETMKAKLAQSKQYQDLFVAQGNKLSNEKNTQRSIDRQFLVIDKMFALGAIENLTKLSAAQAQNTQLLTELKATQDKLQAINAQLEIIATADRNDDTAEARNEDRIRKIDKLLQESPNDSEKFKLEFERAWLSGLDNDALILTLSKLEEQGADFIARQNAEQARLEIEKRDRELKAEKANTQALQAQIDAAKEQERVKAAQPLPPNPLEEEVKSLKAALLAAEGKLSRSEEANATLKSQHQAELERLKSDFASQLSLANAKASQAEADLLAAKKELQTTSEDLSRIKDELAALKLSHAKDIEQLSQQHKASLLHAESELLQAKQALDSARAEHTQEIQKLHAQYQQQIVSLQETHADQLKELKLKLEESNAKLSDALQRISNLESTLAQTQSEHEKQLEKLTSDHQKEISLLNSKHDQTIDELKRKHEKEMKDLLDKLKVSTTDKDSAIRELEKKQGSEITALNTKHQEDTKGLVSSYEDIINQLERKLTKTQDGLKEALTRHAKELKQAKSEVLRANEQLLAAEKAHQHEIKELTDKQQQALADLKAKADHAIAELKAAQDLHGKAIAQLKGDHKGEIEQLTQGHQIAIAKLNETHAADILKLQTALKEAQAREQDARLAVEKQSKALADAEALNRKLEADIKALQAQLGVNEEARNFLTGQLSLSGGDKAGLLAQIAKLEAEQEKLNTALFQKTQESSKLSDQIVLLQREIDKLKAQLAKMEQINTETAKKLQQALAELETAKLALQSAQQTPKTEKPDKPAPAVPDLNVPDPLRFSGKTVPIQKPKPKCPRAILSAESDPTLSFERDKPRGKDIFGIMEASHRDAYLQRAIKVGKKSTGIKQASSLATDIGMKELCNKMIKSIEKKSHIAEIDAAFGDGKLLDHKLHTEYDQRQKERLDAGKTSISYDQWKQNREIKQIVFNNVKIEPTSKNTEYNIQVKDTIKGEFETKAYVKLLSEEESPNIPELPPGKKIELGFTSPQPGDKEIEVLLENAKEISKRTGNNKIHFEQCEDCPDKLARIIELADAMKLVVTYDDTSRLALEKWKAEAPEKRSPYLG